MRRALLAVGLVALAVVLAGCATTSGTMRQQVHEWASGASYDADNTTIEQDLGVLSADTRAHALLELHTDCEGFGADVQTLWGNLPTPNAALTNALNVSLENDFEQASIDCYDAPSFDSATYHRYERELSNGRAEYAVAKRLLASFGVR